MLRRLSVLSIFTSLWPGTCIASDSGLNDRIETALVEEQLVGIAWTLIKGDDDKGVGAVGLRDSRAGLSFDTDTRFHVGSVAKTLLATGVLRLATEGRIELDAPAISYLRDLFPGETPEGFSDVTVRHLLDHTSGLNDAHIWQMFSERADANAPLVAAFPDPASQLRIRSVPGSRFSYSNMGYALLGMIIETVVDNRYEFYMDRHVLARLDMHDSTFTFTTQEGEDADPNLAWGHVDDGSRYAATPTFLRPAGQFTTTAVDLARFAKFLLGDGTIDGQVFIEASLMKSRGKPFGTESANEGLVAGYALGLGRRDRHGVVGYCHGGNIVGFVAMICIFPDEEKAFAYSVNTDSETADYGRLEELFIEALDVPDATPPPTVNVNPDVPEWLGRYVLSPNRFQAFAYLDNVFGAIKLFDDGNSLAMASFQQHPRQLRSVGNRLYSASDRTTASHVLYRDGNGAYLISDGFLTYERVPTAHVVAHWISVLLGIAGMIWILIAGSISLARHRGAMIRRPETPAFTATTLLIVPVPFFLAQSFMSLGDVTFASTLLALVTLMLPLGMLATTVSAIRSGSDSKFVLAHGIAAICVLQWCVVLAVAGMLPFRLWA